MKFLSEQYYNNYNDLNENRLRAYYELIDVNGIK